VTSVFLSVIVDILLPGDRGTPPLPTGTAVGVATELEHLVAGPNGTPHRAVLQAIERAAGGEEAFVRGSADSRVASVRRVEAEMPEPFRALVAVVLQEYYEADAVVLAMGWRPEPPQPRGHVLAPFDEALLGPVRRRARMWR
jgi:hypothetical protein